MIVALRQKRFFMASFTGPTGYHVQSVGTNFSPNYIAGPVKDVLKIPMPLVCSLDCHGNNVTSMTLQPYSWGEKSLATHPHAVQSYPG